MLLQKGREGVFTVGLPSQSNFNLKITILTCDDYEFILITMLLFLSFRPKFSRSQV